MQKPLLVAAVLLLAHPAEAARFQFCWFGSSGYTMQGVIEFPDALLGSGLISQDDVTGFFISGYLDGIPVGYWSLDMLTPETTWVLTFDATKLEFPTGGGIGSYQAWNANGQVDDCGPGGFGFNGGNLYQDVCIDNTWITDSSIEPATPFPVAPEGVEARCANAVPIS